jgi:hypothetical protein
MLELQRISTLELPFSMSPIPPRKVLAKDIGNFLTSRPFPVGSLVRRSSLHSAARRLLKVKSDINGILFAEGGRVCLIRVPGTAHDVYRLLRFPTGQELSV